MKTNRVHRIPLPTRIVSKDNEVVYQLSDGGYLKICNTPEALSIPETEGKSEKKRGTSRKGVKIPLGMYWNEFVKQHGGQCIVMNMDMKDRMRTFWTWYRAKYGTEDEKKKKEERAKEEANKEKRKVSLSCDSLGQSTPSVKF